MKAGTKVIIIQDCRAGGAATGMVGIYEGEMPLEISNPDDSSSVDTIDNPRILLADGSHIWGIECWWKPIDDEPLFESQQNLRIFQMFCREIGYYNNETDPDPLGDIERRLNETSNNNRDANGTIN